MFATSPNYTRTSTSFGGSSSTGGPSQATAEFDHVAVTGVASGRGWTGTAVGGGGPVARIAGGTSPGSEHPGGVFTMTGSGDIARR